jgi:small subunit ribosomal protein S16
MAQARPGFRLRVAHPPAIQTRKDDDVAARIRLMRLGKTRAPHYRIVVADARTKRQGRVIETVGRYHPKDEPSFIEVDSERVRYWLGVGAQPSEPVAAILKVTGDWQSVRGLPAPEPMRRPAPRADRKALFESAAREGAQAAPEEPRAGSRRRTAPAKTTAADAQPAKTTGPDAQPAKAADPDAQPAEPTAAADAATPAGGDQPEPAEQPSSASPPVEG